MTNEADNTNEIETRREPFPHRRELTLGVVVPIAALVFSVFAWGHTVFVGLIDRIVVMDRSIAANTAHRVEHDRATAKLEQHVMDNADDIKQLERALGQLRALPQAGGFDPFSSTEVRALGERMDGIERQLDHDQAQQHD